MKKFKSALVMVSISFLVSACGSEKPASSVEQIQEQATEKDIEKSKENKRKLIGRDKDTTDK